MPTSTLTFSPTAIVQDIVNAHGNAAIPALLKHNPRIFNNIRNAFNEKKLRKAIGFANATLDKLLLTLDKRKKHHRTKGGMVRISQKGLGDLTGRTERSGRTHSHKMQEAGIISVVHRGCQETGASLLRINLRKILSFCDPIKLGKPVFFKQTGKLSSVVPGTEYQSTGSTSTSGAGEESRKEDRRSRTAAPVSIPVRPKRKKRTPRKKKRYPKNENPCSLRLARRKARMAEDAAENAPERPLTALDKRVRDIEMQARRSGFYWRSVFDPRDAETLESMREALAFKSDKEVLRVIREESRQFRDIGQKMYCLTPVRKNWFTHWISERKAQTLRYQKQAAAQIARRKENLSPEELERRRSASQAELQNWRRNGKVQNETQI